ncbi:hypothetical protein [Roseinatronobacter alkalisoli]|uniref:Argininosuccinate lyase n=1 Tax=Roseinatronobacter alkalisoli TaxID=3028235 RepID=A0ABT5T528_9RHOB|nr:hypothetical protein [Roseinatronobacter sp. HJB301]MDD7970227.1 hypothetical protein [Roseinatronobacter sp. HJB301]
MKYAALALVIALAACGADAPPRHDDPSAPPIGISGEVRIGVATDL